jgi:hypothetical protein
MQTKITFFENDFVVGISDEPKMFRPANPVQAFRRFIESSDWDERLLKSEKQINRLSYGLIAAAALFFLPLCISILSR